MLILLIVLLLFFGAGGGYYGGRTWGRGAGIGIPGILLIVLIVLLIEHASWGF